MNGISSTVWLLPALPLFGAVVLLLTGRRSDTWGHLLGCATALASFALGIALFVDMLGRDTADRAVNQDLFEWVPVAGLQIDFGLQLDQLSMCFVLLITGVGSLIHIYSVGYMAHGPDPCGRSAGSAAGASGRSAGSAAGASGRSAGSAAGASGRSAGSAAGASGRSAGSAPGRRLFFAYLNLFLAAMLLLVLADNYFGLYVGWEGVGLASYLLIGFWQYKPSAATAAKKAFVVNRVGDMGLAVAMMIMFATFGSVTFDDVFAGADGASDGVLTALGLVLLLAACGKSAQVPLQSWLGDAMEGPTPVSALIHAATMVTAGVYLIVRSDVLFDLAPTAQLAVVIVGTVTLLFGAVIGCAKDDIKKALAASTMSQIGYMVLAAGLGPAGYAFAIMHLLTHGFFKAGLFLGAGSVMHGMNDEVNMRHYGGLRTVMPITFVTFGLGYLAIIGIPPFAGFFSKDKIIEVAFGAGGAEGIVLGTAALLGAGLTAFYMTRVMLMTFFGRRRWAADVHPHEAPAVMTAPMILLALGSVGAGAALTLGGALQNWLEPVVGAAEIEHLLPVWVITALTLAVVLAGVAVAYRQYARREIPDAAPADVSAFTVAARRDLYGDAVNEAVFMRPGRSLTTTLVTVDDRAVDGAVDGISATVGALSARMRHLQTGFVRSYGLSMLVGAAVVVAAMMLGRL
ncbi:NADH-quinone oxidoreductase subunit L [Rhodococcus ruber]|uniref:NADH dehydrogenase subunit L n=1 Tax=Rhodococcus ruber TaxID=1830 RepID=A0A098BPH7_9NOCA|nr:NADH-quinone oxidoreductase subunit L [Rhodococcus ruber]MBP2211853.1 NADH-quinone oxidoreductase subunit L [Rhodococcus ruber]MCD2127063.1 NADH-quinone oxidoreductase subunit L [Rhodococcus ruber]MCZ4503340.1 NADH-quinone oxidoreductase subunit L [Rhodococcus ruber]MCZ4530565.1 NADH-quinone oxidoreductase subunit L [Rhodococcus ruber]MCZ4622936.1 NADH-quinone oxidoreductase subunit L [Rhodococcus ruber]